MTTIKVTGMTCGHCAGTVERTLGQIEGIEQVQVDLAAGTASFEETKPVDPEIIRARIEKAGYRLG